VSGDSHCDLCGDEIFDISAGDNYYDGIVACNRCMEYLEAHDRHTGRLVVDKCKECGHVRGARFQKYQKKGRPVGSKNAVPKAAKGTPAIF